MIKVTDRGFVYEVNEATYGANPAPEVGDFDSGPDCYYHWDTPCWDEHCRWCEHTCRRHNRQGECLVEGCTCIGFEEQP